MSALTLHLRARPPARVDMSGVTPERLAEAGVRGVAALRVWCGREQPALGDLFDVSGDDPASMVISGGCDRLDHVGAGMGTGSLRVEGDVGHYLASHMRGGSLQVSGGCGALACTAMRGGEVIIDGDAGDSLGGPRAGERRGMSGGLVLVRGNAGARVGERMRRGTVLVEGDVGPACASRMIAGTLAVLGAVGDGCGGGMLRGTLLLANQPASLPPTFQGPLAFDAGFLPLLTRSLASLEGPFGRLPGKPGSAQRHLGDRAVGGLGEVLVLDGWRAS